MKIKLGLSTGIKVGSIGISKGTGVVVPSTYSISGTVYNSDGTTAVAGATVALGALTATSGADGTYTIEGIPPGTSGSMTATKTGLTYPSITIAAMAANLTSQNYTAYTLDDEFTTDRAAGAVNGTASEPGPGGNREVTDTGSLVTISGGKLVIVGKNTYDDPMFHHATAITRAAGLALLFGYTTDVGGQTPGRIEYVGLHPNKTSATSLTHGFIIDSQAQGVKVKNGSAEPSVAAVLSAGSYEFAVVLRANGAFFIRRDNNSLLYVTDAGNAATLYTSITKYYAQTGRFDYMRVIQLGAPWKTQYGMATATSATPATGATIATTADAFIELTWTPAAAEVLDIQFRRTDDDNCWILRCDQAANTIKLFSKQSGTEAEVDAGKTMTWGTTAKHICIRVDGANIRTWVGDTPKHVYGSASFNQTATGAKVSGHSSAANFVSWPGGVSLPSPFDYVDRPAANQFLVVGDSKSLDTTPYPSTLKSLLNTASPGPRGWDYRVLGYSGDASVEIATQIDAGLATLEYIEPGFVCINIGINDMTDNNTQEEFETNMAYILEAIHTRWPAAQMYLMRPWGINFGTQPNTFAGYIDNIIATRAWAHLGPDERVFLENGDNGATYMGDSVHPNPAGYALTAQKWSEIILGA